MYLMYVDESGDPGVGQHCSPHLAENKNPGLTTEDFLRPQQNKQFCRGRLIFSTMYSVFV